MFFFFFFFFFQPVDYVTKENIDLILQILQEIIDQAQQKQSESSLSREDSENLCTICYAEPITTVFEPCHHQ